MTRYLWTGESEYCICGHHVTDHETSQWPVSMTRSPMVICRGAWNVRAIANCKYGCDEFRSCRIRTIGEDNDSTIDVEELVIPLKSSTSGITLARQLIDTTSSTEISYDSTS
jgi:hypothetical protein